MSEVKKKKTTKKDDTKVKTTKKVAETKKEKKVKVTKKEEKNILNKEEQRKYTVLSRVIRIFAKIARVCLMILIPFIALAMILIPIVFNKFEVSANVVKFGSASIVIRDDGLSLKLGDKIHVLDCNTTELDQLVTFLSEHSKGTVVFSLELTLLILAVITIFEIYLLVYIEKLFGNFEKDKTPFTKENTDYILIIAKFLVAIKISTICMALVGLINYGLTTVGIIEILVVFASYYIFKYATGMQKQVDTKICD